MRENIFYFRTKLITKMNKKIIMYTTTWCPDCRNAKRILAEKNISFEEIDIDKDESAADKIIEWSGGRRVIPTFHITNEKNGIVSILHNPKEAVLLKELES